MVANSVRKTLEVHEHSYIVSDWRKPNVEHSHTDHNSIGHQHPETGPGVFTIDKDEWLRATGLRGGGRKTFTARPKGEQLPVVELADWQKSFMVVFVDNGLTPEHVRAGVTELELERARREFKAAETIQAFGRESIVGVDRQLQAARLKRGLEGEGGGAAVARMALTFDMEPIYQYVDDRP